MKTTTKKSESDGRALPPRSVVGPMVVSVVVHALLLLMLATVALNVEPSEPGVRTPDESFVITLDEPAPIEPEPIRTSTSPAVPSLELTSDHVELPSASDMVAMAGSGTASLVGIGRGGGGVASLVRRNGSGAAGVSFAGLATKRVHRVVYVVDGSGSMVTSLPFVIEELLRSVDRLSASQRFAVVLFRNRPPRSGNPGGGEAGRNRAKYDVFASADGAMLLADDRNKRRLRDWAGRLVPRGISNPSDGLARALSFNPDAVFLLARSIRRSGPNAGWGVGLGEIMAELDAANPLDAKTQRRRTVIKTIQFIDEDPTGTMQRIGNEHGSAEGESGYTLLTLPALEALEHDLPVEDGLGRDAQMDRAVEILSALSATGRDTAAIFGIGVEAERAAAAKEADKALRAALRSEATDDLALLVRGRSRILKAAAGDRDQLADAIDDLESVGVDGPAVVRLNLATAHLMRASQGDRERAAAILTTIDGSSLDPTSFAELLMARVWADISGARGELLAHMAGEPFRTPEGVDGSLVAAAADVFARRAAGQTNRDTLSEALEPWAELIRDGTLGREALLTRAAAAAADFPGEGLPIEVAYAVGRAALRGEIVRADTIELLDRVVEEAGEEGKAGGWLEVSALRDGALARVASWESDRDSATAIAAAERLLRYVRRTPGSEDRQEMLTLSLGLCERVMLGESDATLRATVEAVYAAGTALAIEVLPREHGRSDRWVCAYARDLMATDTDDAGEAANRERALTLLEPIGRDSPAANNAAALRLYARLGNTRDLRRAVTLARSRRDSAALEMAGAALLAECDRAAADAAAVGGESADWLLADRADALVEMGKPEAGKAETIYDDLLARKVAVPGGTARLLLGRARAMLAADNAASAFAALRDLAKSLDKPAPDGNPRPTEFWHAWTLLIEISASNGRPVRAHIAGLFEIDPDLGGEPWRARLNAAAQR